MTCASLCLSKPGCNGFEIIDEQTCNMIDFYKLEKAEKDSPSSKQLWLSSILLQFESKFTIVQS